MRTAVLLVSLALVGLGTQVPNASPANPQAKPFLGAWNINGTGPDAAIVCWLEVTEEAGQLRGMFLNRVGSPAPLGIVRVEGDELIFRSGTVERPNGPEYHAKIENGKLVGRYTVTQGGGRGRANVDPNAPPPPQPTERVVNWVGARLPAWPAGDANAKHTYGAPVVLFDNKSLDMWGVQVQNRPIGWAIVDGAMTNYHDPANTDQRAAGNNLVSKEKFLNFKVEAEYKLAAGSNSGIYLRGRYELQLLDDLTDTTTPPILSHMAIYGRTPPLVKASKPVGEWQTMEAIVVSNRVTVTLNGQRVHDNAVILGVTGGMLDNDELAPGPLLIQGDHRAVWIRKLVVTPIIK
jgi:hypothetical protein